MSEEARAEAERITMYTEDRGRSEWLTARHTKGDDRR